MINAYGHSFTIMECVKADLPDRLSFVRKFLWGKERKNQTFWNYSGYFWRENSNSKFFFVGCLVTRWNSLKKVVCIVIVKRKNGKWKCKLSFDGLGLLKYGLLFPRSFSKLSFVTEAAHPRQELPGRWRKLERQFSTWKTSPFFKDQMVAKNTLRYSQIPSLPTCLYSFKKSSK